MGQRVKLKKNRGSVKGYAIKTGNGNGNRKYVKKRKIAVRRKKI